MLIARDNNVNMLTIGQTGVHIIFQPSPKWTNRATLLVFEYVVYLDNLIKKHSKLKFRKKKKHLQDTMLLNLFTAASNLPCIWYWVCLLSGHLACRKCSNCNKTLTLSPVFVPFL